MMSDEHYGTKDKGTNNRTRQGGAADRPPAHGAPHSGRGEEARGVACGEREAPAAPRAALAGGNPPPNRPRRGREVMEAIHQEIPRLPPPGQTEMSRMAVGGVLPAVRGGRDVALAAGQRGGADSAAPAGRQRAARVRRRAKRHAGRGRSTGNTPCAWPTTRW